MSTQTKIWGFTLITAAALAACGGGGGGTASTTGGSGNALTGVVVDGLIEGATVCLDLNNSLSCDGSEPSATTKADGGYSLDTTGLSASQLQSAHIFVTVPADAKDADDGGKTLADAGKAAFNLLAPAQTAVGSDGKVSGSVVVTPLTTLVSHEMLLDGKSAELAQGSVKNKLGLDSSVDLTQNFAGKSDATSQDLAKKAQVLAVTLGEVTKQIRTDAATATAKEQLLGALSYLKTNAKAVVDAAAAQTNQPTVQAVKTSLAQDALKPVAATLVTEAQTAVNTSPVIGSTTATLETLLKEGFYKGGCNQMGWSQQASKMVCEKWYLYAIKSTEAGKWISTSYSIASVETSFTQAVPDPDKSSYRLLEGEGWVSQSVNPKAGTYAIDSTGLATVTSPLSSSKSETFTVRSTVKDIGGMKLSDLGGSVKYLLQYAPSGVGDTVLPAGSKLMQSTDTYRNEEYWLSYGKTQKCSSSSSSCVDLTDFTALAEAYSTPAEGNPGGQIWFYINDSSSSGSYTGPWYYGTFDLDSASSTGGRITVWQSNDGSAPTKLTEKASYTIKTVHGQPILLINPSATVLAARLKATGSSVGMEQIYAIREGKLYSGNYASVQARNLDSSNHGAAWNKTAAETIIKAMGGGATALPQ